MKTFTEFCQRYELDPATQGAQAQYNEYQSKLALFRDVASGPDGQEEEPASLAFETAMGPMSLADLGANNFFLISGNMGLVVLLQRQHIAVERWEARPEEGEPAGAHLHLLANGGFRATLRIPPDEAARLAWFAGVTLQEGDDE